MISILLSLRIRKFGHMLKIKLADSVFDGPHFSGPVLGKKESNGYSS